MSKYIRDKENRLYEYRGELARLNNEIKHFEVTFHHTEKRGVRIVALLNNMYLLNEDGKKEFICIHTWANMISNVTKDVFKHINNGELKEGQQIKIRAKVKEYTNRKGQNNYGIEIKKIYW